MDFFSFFPKIMDWEGLLGTLGDAQRGFCGFPPNA